jgi:hypothetical protein
VENEPDIEGRSVMRQRSAVGMKVESVEEPQKKRGGRSRRAVLNMVHPADSDRQMFLSCRWRMLKK